MSDLRINGLAFDRGIDDIVYAGKDTGTRQLPDRQDLPPSADGVRAQLSQLLDKPNTDRFLDEALKPAIGNRELLSPGRFSQALAQAQQALADAAERAQQNGDDAGKVLNRAVRLLKEEAGLRELIAMYRSVLYQG
ncbi:hypothetical protein [Bordetella genomosp. 13]|uniref:type III secretion apparatus assembly protein SctX n=1 Tax=Bordetella genomosp. 13 TaxID=463040 RepID=UPI00119E5CDA|nr:hypothetical protein [Bordetella genomosp. 13]